MKDIYEELGVRTFINAAGTYTIAGGSRMSEETLETMKSAASHFVMIKEFQQKIHSEIARLTKNEAAYISNGAATGLYLAIAAAIQQKHGKCRFYYMDHDVIKSYNIVMFKSHRNPYDLVIGHLGAEYRELGFPNIISPVTAEDVYNAIDENTAAFYYAEANWTAPGTLCLTDVIKIAGEKNIPVIVDAAAQLPPVENLWKFGQLGATATLFSGGKDLCGPQSSGLIVGKKEFLNIVNTLGFPNYGIGRMMKVGREEMAGLYSAVRQYIEMDHDKRREWCEKQVEMIIQAFSESELFLPERSFPNEAGQPIPRAYIKVNDKFMSVEKICKLLLEGVQSIYVNGDGQGFFINPMTLEEGETEIVIEALKRIERREGTN